jgi:hypothetical protein
MTTHQAQMDRALQGDEGNTYMKETYMQPFSRGGSKTDVTNLETSGQDTDHSKAANAQKKHGSSTSIDSADKHKHQKLRRKRVSSVYKYAVNTK